MQSTCLKKQGDTWSDRGITSCSSSPCQINGVFFGEGSAAVSGRRSTSLIERLPRILWLCCAASPGAADGGNGFSRGRYTKYTKLQRPQTGAGQTLLLTSGISFLPFRFFIFFPFFSTEGWIHHRSAKYRHWFVLCLVRFYHTSYRAPPLLLARPITEPPIWFHWLLCTWGHYHNGGCHW